MYADFQAALLELLNSIEGVKAEEYFGEISDMEKPKIPMGSLPIVYVDFVKDVPEAIVIHNLFFNLYIVHASFSKNKTHRTASNISVLELINSIDKKITAKQIIPQTQEGIVLKESAKIFDAQANGAYITIYKKTISCKLIGEMDV